MPARRNFSLFVLAALLLPAACQIHSPGQLELARKLLDRYTASFADALAVTESLPAEEERLLASYRSSYSLIAATEELALLNATWSSFCEKAQELQALVKQLRQDRATEKEMAGQAATHLKAVKQPLSAALSALNKGLKEADAAPTLDDQLKFVSTSINGAITSIGEVDKAIDKAAAAATAAGSGMARLTNAVQRLKPLAPKLKTYFESVATGPTRAKGQNAPLAIEATRLARDILAIEADIIDQELAYQEDIAALANETLQGLPHDENLTGMLDDIDTYITVPGNRATLSGTLRTLAHQGDASEDEMRVVLGLAGTWYYTQIQSARAKDSHELKTRILAYRQAKLLDLAYDRQRRTLISYGLLAAVRYAEGGWKSQDTANLISLIQAGLQAGLLAKI